MKSRAVLVGMICSLLAMSTFAQNRSTAESLRAHFHDINHKVLAMAKDFPEDKYVYRLRPEMRTFRELIVHIAGGNVYAAKAGKGEKVEWTDLDANTYKTKAEVVAMFEKTMADADQTLQAFSDDELTKNGDPWIDVTEHSGEHYGLLVAYYRENGLVPPASRKK